MDYQFFREKGYFKFPPTCKAISKNRIEVLGKSYREMIGAPGSSFFTQMENGILRYKVFYFTKKNE